MHVITALTSVKKLQGKWDARLSGRQNDKIAKIFLVLFMYFFSFVCFVFPFSKKTHHLL